jgi:hypothetical protein
MRDDTEERTGQRVLNAIVEQRDQHQPHGSNPMNQVDQEFGKPNPNAPAALSRFGFLIGRWRCEAKVRSANGEWQTFQATWLGRYILDGYAIADEYRMTASSEELIVLGLNIRAYDAAKEIWNIKWLNALAGTWTDLAPSELGGLRFDGQSIIYAFKEPVAAHAYTRATYTNISKTHFTWRGEKSDDGKAWSEFMVVEANRTKE